jgi:DNA-binding transcriptional MerR regulator
MNDPLLTLREYAKLAPWNIRDLAALAGAVLDASAVTPINAAAQSRPSDRTIRFYVARQLMSPPEGRGTAATYGYRHLLQLFAIKLRQMEGVTLATITKELAESPGDVLEKRVASALGNLPTLEELTLQPRVAPRGRVRRAMQHWATPPARPLVDDGGAVTPDAAAGMWVHVPLGDGLALEVRADHPAARSDARRQRLADALARAVRAVAEEPAP